MPRARAVTVSDTSSRANSGTSSSAPGCGYAYSTFPTFSNFHDPAQWRAHAPGDSRNPSFTTMPGLRQSRLLTQRRSPPNSRS